jgi:ArsR family transcriptional regulator
MRFTQTKVSRHLAYLRRAGLVQVRRQGLWMLYSIARPKDPQREAVLGSLGSLLQSNPVARRDAQRLLSHIQKGCCATYSVVTPKALPAIVELPTH